MAYRCDRRPKHDVHRSDPAAWLPCRHPTDRATLDTDQPEADPVVHFALADAYVPAVALTRQLFTAFQSSAATLARRASLHAHPPQMGEPSAQDR